MIIGVYVPILTHKNTKGTVGKPYPYSTRLEKIVVVIIHIYGARCFFLLFYDNQDTKYESREMEIGVDGPIFNHKYTKGLREHWYP